LSIKRDRSPVSPGYGIELIHQKGTFESQALTSREISGEPGPPEIKPFRKISGIHSFGCTFEGTKLVGVQLPRDNSSTTRQKMAFTFVFL